MAKGASRLERIAAALRKLYGPPPPPPVTDPWEMILFETIAYLAADAKRLAAWKRFRRTIGSAPGRILAAPASTILPLARAGILAEDRVERLKDAAAIAEKDFGGDVDGALASGSTADARRALRKFPGIGEPGAEKILLFSRREKALALESNGLRVLLRLGYGREEKSYAASYASVREATGREWRSDFDWLIAAHQLLRRHGQELCKRSRPLCDRCPLTRECVYFGSNSLGA
jgi:endonuclease III